MTKEEIIKEIKREERNIENCKSKIEDIKFEMTGCRKAIKFWKGQLKTAKKGAK